MILVTGGAGFVGVNYILRHFRLSGGPLVNLDAEFIVKQQVFLKTTVAHSGWVLLIIV